MQILAPNTTPQTMTIIPRSYDVDSIVITDEDENKSYTIASGDITNTTDRYYLYVAVNFPNNTFGDSILKEGRFYTIDFLLGTDKVYRDNVFCTSQGAYDYSINKDQYDEYESTNEYIVI